MEFWDTKGSATLGGGVTLSLLTDAEVGPNVQACLLSYSGGYIGRMFKASCQAAEHIQAQPAKLSEPLSQN